MLLCNSTNIISASFLPHSSLAQTAERQGFDSHEMHAPIKHTLNAMQIVYIYTFIWNICAPIYPCMSALDAISLHSPPPLHWSDYLLSQMHFAASQSWSEQQPKLSINVCIYWELLFKFLLQRIIFNSMWCLPLLCRGLLPDPNPRVPKYFRVSG